MCADKDAVGIDDKETTSAEEKHAMKKEMERNKLRRAQEKKDLHDYKEIERQNIRDKYQLKTASTSSSTSSSTKTDDKNDKNCCIS